MLTLEQAQTLMAACQTRTEMIEERRKLKDEFINDLGGYLSAALALGSCGVLCNEFINDLGGYLSPYRIPAEIIGFAEFLTQPLPPQAPQVAIERAVWVKHVGMACPVDRDQLVCVTINAGDVTYDRAGRVLWDTPLCNPNRVAAYLVISPISYIPYEVAG